MATDQVSLINDAANRMRISGLFLFIYIYIYCSFITLTFLAIDMTCASKSGHPTSSASAAEIVATLFFGEMRYSVEHPRHVGADRFILSKGHACPILYAAWEEAGLLTKEQTLTLRKIDSDIEGHPTPVSYLIPTICSSEIHSCFVASQLYRCCHRIAWTRSRICCWYGLCWKIYRQSFLSRLRSSRRR